MGYIVKLGEPRPGEKPAGGKGQKQGAAGAVVGGVELSPRVLMIGGGALAVVALAVGLFMAFGRGDGGGYVSGTTVAGDAGSMPAGAMAGDQPPGSVTAPGMAPGMVPGQPMIVAPGMAPPASGDLPPSVNMGGAGGGPGSVTVGTPGSPGFGAPGADVQYGPRAPVSVPKPGGGSWNFSPVEQKS